MIYDEPRRAPMTLIGTGEVDNWTEVKCPTCHGYMSLAWITGIRDVIYCWYCKNPIVEVVAFL